MRRSIRPVLRALLPVGVAVTLALPFTALARHATARAPRLIMSSASLTVAEGTSFSPSLASISDRSPGTKLKATVVWGDGHHSKGKLVNAGGQITICARHEFRDEGHYSAVIAAHDSRGHAITGRLAITVTEADTFTAPISDPRPATVNQPVTGQIAVFSDNGYPNNVPGDFTATIDWGDGVITPGVVTRPALGLFAVSGAHTYTSVKLFTAVVTIKDGPPGTAVGITHVPIDVRASAP